MEAKDNYSAEKILDADINQHAQNSNDAGGFRDDLNAGETINGETLPVAIFINTSDNEVYSCDGNDQARLEFIGFAISNSTDGNPISIQCSGVVRGFSGLAEGQKYYVQDDRTIGTTPGTYEVLVGKAISTTELVIEKGSDQYIGTETGSTGGDTDSATCTFTMPAKARKALLQMSFTASGSDTLVIHRNGKTSASSAAAGSGTGGAQASISCSLSGSTITCTSNETANDNNASCSGTAYYYD